jgi:transposase
VFDCGVTRVAGVSRPIRPLIGASNAEGNLKRNQTPMKKSIHYIGLDVHKETIAVAIAPDNASEVRAYGIIGGTLDAVDKLLKKLASPKVELRLVYEVGPCGFVLHRHLKNKGLRCDVVAPSLIPKKASDRVKTDRCDATQLARLFRAGELTPIYVPDQEDEAKLSARWFSSRSL